MSSRRALVAQHTTLRPTPGIPEIRLHLANDAGPVWRATEAALRIDGAPIPFWAFAWAGGLALARYVLDHAAEVRGRSVLDFASGSGLVAIAACKAGATDVLAADIDPFAEIAVGRNARANGVRLAFAGRDLLDEPPPDVDVILAADTWYDEAFAERLLPWLQEASARGTRVLVGDPVRRYFPADSFAPLATYDVQTTTELEDRASVRSGVFAMVDSRPTAPRLRRTRRRSRNPRRGRSVRSSRQAAPGSSG